MPQTSPGAPSPIKALREKTLKSFGQNPCLWQTQVVQSILLGDKDIILIAATGSGKTMTFWMPLLAVEGSIQIICAPLNLLGTVNAALLTKQGIPAICITAENATPANFSVSAHVPFL
jgi:superfamily II DNA helicase RecQ